jgi:type I restriction enzyme S subunit
VDDGDIVVASSGNTYGKVGRINKSHLPIMMNTSVIRLHSANLNCLDNDYLYVYLRSPHFHQQIEQYVIGSAQPNFGPSHLKLMKIILPDLGTQHRISSFITAYDDLIENNTRRIRILEEMTQAIYREWFVNFRFPGHEGVRMVESEMGITPEGWTVSSLGDLLTIHRGKSYSSDNLVTEGGYPFLTLKCIKRDGGFRFDGIKRFSGEFKIEQTAKPGDIIIAVTDMTQERRIVGHAGRVPNTGDGLFIMSMDLIKVVTRFPEDNPFLYSYLRFSDFSTNVKMYANGANVLHLNPQRIAEFRFIEPDRGIRDEFGKLVAPLFSEGDILLSENTNLYEQRDLLLPKLISGKLDVQRMEPQSYIG